MLEPTLSIAGVRVPRFLYGTAWKEETTQGLTELAIQQGFRGIDTANQRRHYHEAAVGQGIAAAIASGLVTRDELFLQTKFTFQLHGPSVRNGLAQADWAAWRAMETIHASGRARLLGVSNITLDQLHQLYQAARVRPSFVQNRCFAVLGWDRQIRKFCDEQEIAYQGFSLLTANPEALAHPELTQIAQRHGHTPSQIVFRFALDVGMIPLTGTTNADHMRADLDVFDFQLDPAEVEQIEGIVAR
ncbi:MAG: aldo/keto reductase [Planctomycetes bacterium]|nr:aldo/keto reductase [Planctomycetota bacterium]